MKPKALILIGFLAATAAILVTTLTRDKPAAEVKPAVGASPTATAGDKVAITFVYGTEKKDWLEAAVGAFRAEHPEITVDLVGRGSLEAAQQILDGALQPTCSARPTPWS